MFYHVQYLTKGKKKKLKKIVAHGILPLWGEEDMTAKERFDKITTQIEERIVSDRSAKEIAEEVAESQGMSRRDLSTVFLFLTGQTLDVYIKERKMNASYETMIELEDFDSSAAVEISGCGDQATFNKKFKKSYGVTPTQAFEKKDAGLLKYILSWDELDRIEISSAGKRKEKMGTSKSIFGLTRNKYNEIKELLDLMSLYNFDEELCDLAHFIYAAYNVPMADAFDFVDSYMQDLDDMEARENYPSFREYKERLITHVKRLVSDPEVRYAFFECEVGAFSLIEKVIEKLHNAGEEDITQVDVDVIKTCATEEIDVTYCKEAVKYFKDNATDEHGEDAFEEYLNYVLSDVPIEIAFDSIINLEIDIEEMKKDYVSPELEIYDYEVLETFIDFSERTDDADEMYYDRTEDERVY